MLTIDVLALFM